MFQYAGAARFAYNWALNREKENHKNGGKFISDNDLRKEFTQLKKSDGYKWLNNVSNDVTKQAIKDACSAYMHFFRGLAKFPRFKSRKHSPPSFYQDTEKIRFTDTHVKVEGFATSRKKNRQKLNWIRLAEHGRIPTDSKYTNPRIKYDGINWYLTVGIECEDADVHPSNDGIGIDLGIKDLAICSDGHTYPNINKTQKVKKLEKRKRRLQRSISRRYEKNKKGESYRKTCNIIKSEKKLLRVNHKLTDIRRNCLHQATLDIVETVYDITDEEYEIFLIEKDAAIQKSILETCHTSRRTQYYTADTVAASIAKKYMLPRISSNWKKDTSTPQAKAHVMALIHDFINKGYLVSETNNNTLYIRTINKTEQKQQKLIIP